MPTKQLISPESVGLSSDRLDRAFDILRDIVASGAVPAASTAILRQGKTVHLGAFGKRDPASDRPDVVTDTIFLIASLTKPVVCAGFMLLVQDGLLDLGQTVASLVPEFGAHGKDAVRVLHLMTHTSGLPDQLENNIALRTRHAPLTDFSASVCDLELLFPPGTDVSYQSMGILMLQEIAERFTGERLRDFLHERLFCPLGMMDTTLGMPDSGMARTALLGCPLGWPACHRRGSGQAPLPHARRCARAAEPGDEASHATRSDRTYAGHPGRAETDQPLGPGLDAWLSQLWRPGLAEHVRAHWGDRNDLLG